MINPLCICSNIFYFDYHFQSIPMSKENIHSKLFRIILLSCKKKSTKVIKQLLNNFFNLI